MNITVELFFEDETVVVRASSPDFAELLRQIINCAISNAAYKDVRHCKVQQVYII